MTDEKTICQGCNDKDLALRSLRRTTTDRQYMLEAVVQMLGPKGRQVWEMWQTSGVERVHTSWGPDAAKLSGEQIAELHLKLEAAPKQLITNIDGHLETTRFDAPMSEVPQVDVREFVASLAETPTNYPTPEMISAAQQAAESTGKRLDERSEELTQAVREGLEEGAKLSFDTPKLSHTDHMRTLRTLLTRPGSQDYRVEEAIKYLDRLVLVPETTSSLPEGYPNVPLKEQVRPLGQSLSAFDVIGDEIRREKGERDGG